MCIVFRVVSVTSLMLPMCLICGSVHDGDAVTGKLVVVSSTIAFVVVITCKICALLSVVHNSRAFGVCDVVFVFVVLVGIALYVISLLEVETVGGTSR